MSFPRHSAAAALGGLVEQPVALAKERRAGPVGDRQHREVRPEGVVGSEAIDVGWSSSGLGDDGVVADLDHPDPVAARAAIDPRRRPALARGPRPSTPSRRIPNAYEPPTETSRSASSGSKPKRRSSARGPPRPRYRRSAPSTSGDQLAVTAGRARPDRGSTQLTPSERVRPTAAELGPASRQTGQRRRRLGAPPGSRRRRSRRQHKEQAAASQAVDGRNPDSSRPGVQKY